MRPYRRAIETTAVSWAARHGFSRVSAHVFRRATNVSELLEVIEVQKSCKHPHQTFTINLGFYHPAFSTDPPPAPSEVASVHCARRIRIGHLMPKRFLIRIPLWLRHGSGWHWWQLFPGDFWWAYRDTDDSPSSAMSHALSQAERYGLPWFSRFSSLRNASEFFDRSHFTVYESAGFYPQPRSA